MKFKALLNFTVASIIYNSWIIYIAKWEQEKLIKDLKPQPFGWDFYEEVIDLKEEVCMPKSHTEDDVVVESTETKDDQEITLPNAQDLSELSKKKLQEIYKDKIGKRPFGGWDKEKLIEKLS